MPRGIERRLQRLEQTDHAERENEGLRALEKALKSNEPIGPIDPARDAEFKACVAELVAHSEQAGISEQR